MLEQIESEIVNKANNNLISGGRHHEMNLKDIKELCKANQTFKGRRWQTGRLQEEGTDDKVKEKEVIVID